MILYHWLLIIDTTLLNDSFEFYQESTAPDLYAEWFIENVPQGITG